MACVLKVVLLMCYKSIDIIQKASAGKIWNVFFVRKQSPTDTPGFKPFTKKNINVIQFEKRTVHVNHASHHRVFDFEGKKPWGLVFFGRSQTHRKTSELQYSSKCPRIFSEIFGSSRIIFGNSDTLQDKNLTPVTQNKLAYKL